MDGPELGAESPPRLVLASASPRRSELLRAAGIRFAVDPADVDESVAPGTDPVEAALELAARKADAVAARRRGADEWILAADTVVACPVEGELRLLGKPEDEAEARRFLGWLSATRHLVVTGVAALRTADGARAAAAERTWVTMRAIAPEEAARYAASGEWRGKAGGYAIQETADAFVTALEEGGFDNVVGLPVGLARRLLERLGLPL